MNPTRDALYLSNYNSELEINIYILYDRRWVVNPAFFHFG